MAKVVDSQPNVEIEIKDETFTCPSQTAASTDAVIELNEEKTSPSRLEDGNCLYYILCSPFPVIFACLDCMHFNFPMPLITCIWGQLTLPLYILACFLAPFTCCLL